MSKKIFLDGGTHFGQGLKIIARKEKIDKTWKVFTWEPNPYTFEDNINTPSRFEQFNITFYNSALSTNDDTVEFLVLKQIHKHTKELVKTGQGSTLLGVKDFSNEQRKQNQIYEQVKVNCINLVDWIRNNTDQLDQIIIKLDIEGSEYPVLEKLIKSDQIYKIKKIYVEWHHRDLKDPQSYLKRQENIENFCAKNNIKVISWI